MRLERTWDALRVGRIASLAAVAFMLATGALADHRSGHGAAEQDVATALSQTNRTIVIGAETFRLTPKATVFDAEGRRMRLAEVSIATDGQLVEFELGENDRDGTPTVRRLQLVDGDFE